MVLQLVDLEASHTLAILVPYSVHNKVPSAVIE